MLTATIGHILAVSLSATLLLVAAASPAAANVDQYIDAENAIISGSTLTDNGQPHALLQRSAGEYPTISNDTAIAGWRSVRAYIDPDTTVPTSSDRSEVVIKETMPMSTHRVVGFSVFIPPTMPIAQGPQDSAYLIFCQFWQYDGARPPITLELRPNAGVLTYQLVVRNDLNNGWPVRYQAPVPGGGGWVRFALDIQSNSVANGYVKLYVNGTHRYTFDRNRVPAENGRVGYSTAMTPTQTMEIRNGIYRTGGIRWPAMHMYFDEMKYGDTLSEVL